MRPISAILPFLVQRFRPKGPSGVCDFGPVQQARCLHPHPSVGRVTLVDGRAGWKEDSVRCSQLTREVREREGRADQYISQQAFRGSNRRTRDLVRIGACYIDIDVYALDQHAARSPEQVAGDVLDRLKQAAVPEPSWIMFTGRGLCVVWLHGILPPRALPRWRAVQSHLLRALAGFNPDPCAIDPSRVFRIAGSVNSKSGAVVRPVHLRDGVMSGHRYSFDQMAAVLPISREDLAARRAEEQAKRGRQANLESDKPAGPAPKQRLDWITYYTTALEDLTRLINLRWGGPIPDGWRDPTLFCVAAAMAWVYPTAVLEATIFQFAEQHAGWSPAKSRNKLGHIIVRAHQSVELRSKQADDHPVKHLAAAGGKTEQVPDPKYALSVSITIERLQITQEEMRDAGLRLFVAGRARNACIAERQRQSRRRRGVPDRATFDAARGGKAQADAQAILEANDRLESAGAVARALGIGIGAARKRLQRARAAQLDTARHG